MKPRRAKEEAMCWECYGVIAIGELMRELPYTDGKGELEVRLPVHESCRAKALRATELPKVVWE